MSLFDRKHKPFKTFIRVSHDEGEEVDVCPVVVDGEVTMAILSDCGPIHITRRQAVEFFNLRSAE